MKIRGYRDDDRKGLLELFVQMLDDERKVDELRKPGKESAEFYMNRVFEDISKCDGQMLVADEGG